MYPDRDHRTPGHSASDFSVKREPDFLDPSSMSEADVDAELRAMGADPDEIAARGLAFVEQVKREVRS